MKRQIITIALGFAVNSFLPSAVADVGYEAPPVFLPAKLLKSPYHSFGSKVPNDGQMNHYTIKSKFGTVKADSTAELKIRVDEMSAFAAMERVSNSDQFTRQVKHIWSGQKTMRDWLNRSAGR